MNEKRKQQRMGSRINVYIELAADNPDSQQGSEVIHCDSVNLSAEGLRVITNTALLEGSILHIGAELNPQACPLFLAAKVVWCTPANDGNSHIAGLHLLHASDSDQKRWYRYIERRIQQQHTTAGNQ